MEGKRLRYSIDNQLYHVLRMMDVHAHCEALAAPPGADLRYALMGLDLERRRAIIALHALQQELNGIPDSVSEPEVARRKLDWWGEELECLLVGRPRHPVAQALVDAVERHALDPATLHELHAAAVMDLDYNRYPGFGQLVVYCHRAGSSLALLRGRVLGYRESRTAVFAHELGVMLTLARQLLEVRAAAQVGRCYLPEVELERFEVRFADLLGNRTDERLEALFRFQLERIHAYHEQALGHLPDADRRDQCRQLVLAELVLARLAEVEAEGFRLLEQGTRLTPLTKFRLAWRVLRRERRRHRRS